MDSFRSAPETCTDMFRSMIESIFITHAETLLNTIGNMLNVKQHDHYYYPMDDPWLIRGNEWCQGLLHRLQTTTINASTNVLTSK